MMMMLHRAVRSTLAVPAKFVFGKRDLAMDSMHALAEVGDAFLRFVPIRSLGR